MKRVVVGAQLLLACAAALADSWMFPAERSDKVYEFGRTKVVLTTDARHNQVHPSFTLRIFDDGRLVAEHADVAFQHLAALDRQQLFIGVSNDGLPGTAMLIFDRAGHLLLKLDHAFKRFDYCRQSVTRIREWVDPNDPAFARDGATGQISFVDCRGRRVLLDDFLRRTVGTGLDALRRPP